MNDQAFEIFLVTIPGLEKYTAKEVENKAMFYFEDEDNFSFEVLQTGVGIKSLNLFQLLEFTKVLNTPSRALLRIEHFVARDLPKLFNKLKKIKWNEYIPTKNFEIKASSKQSRIIDTRRIESALKDAIKDYQFRQPYKEKLNQLKWQTPPTVYIRIENDQCTISIDTSGERLDKRGLKLLTSKAPVRESIAAAFIMNLEKNVVDSTVIDPMCGSGTLISELVNKGQINKSRDYNFENFPIFRKLSKQKLRFEESLYQGDVILNDIDKNNSQLISKNLTYERAIVKNLDFFKSTSSDFPKNSVYICNLPYGKRIRTKNTVQDFTQNFIKHCKSLNAKSVYMIVPDTIKIQSEHQAIESSRVNNGGIWIKFVKINF